MATARSALRAAAWRWLRDPFRLVPPPPDARVLRGTVRTDDDFGAALTIAASTRKWGDLETASFRTRKMTLETPEGDYEVHGPVTVLGHDLTAGPERRAVRRRVALLGHSTGLYEDLTVVEML